jgi:hypothetical protein
MQVRIAWLLLFFGSAGSRSAQCNEAPGMLRGACTAVLFIFTEAGFCNAQGVIYFKWFAFEPRLVYIMEVLP